MGATRSGFCTSDRREREARRCMLCAAMSGLPCKSAREFFRGQPRRADPGINVILRRTSGRRSCFLPPKRQRLPACDDARTLPCLDMSTMPGKRWQFELTMLLEDGADRSGICLGHGDHAGSMELVAWAQQAERLWWSSRDGRQGCTPRADREVTIQSVSGYRSSSAESKMAQRHVSPALRHQLLQAGQRLMPAAAFAPTAT